MGSAQFLPISPEAMGAMIAWLYFVTNAARVVTYVPQIVVVWRDRGGAHAISLLTWGSWVVSHLAAVLYGVAVVRDVFFVVISTINLVCCAAVTGIAARRRHDAARKESVQDTREPTHRQAAE